MALGSLWPVWPAPSCSYYYELVVDWPWNARSSQSAVVVVGQRAHGVVINEGPQTGGGVRPFMGWSSAKALMRLSSVEALEGRSSAQPFSGGHRPGPYRVVIIQGP